MADQKVVKVNGQVQIVETRDVVVNQYSYDSCVSQIARLEDQIKNFDAQKATELQALNDQLTQLQSVKGSF